jgi:hypothetical protein
MVFSACESLVKLEHFSFSQRFSFNPVNVASWSFSRVAKHVILREVAERRIHALG